MFDCADSARLSSDARLGEIAAILAAGILRLRQRAALPTTKTLENPPKQPQKGLELSPETRLSVRGG